MKTFTILRHPTPSTGQIAIRDAGANEAFYYLPGNLFNQSGEDYTVIDASSNTVTSKDAIIAEMFINASIPAAQAGNKSNKSGPSKK